MDLVDNVPFSHFGATDFNSADKFNFSSSTAIPLYDVFASKDGRRFWIQIMIHRQDHRHRFLFVRGKELTDRDKNTNPWIYARDEMIHRYGDLVVSVPRNSETGHESVRTFVKCRVSPDGPWLYSPYSPLVYDRKAYEEAEYEIYNAGLTLLEVFVIGCLSVGILIAATALTNNYASAKSRFDYEVSFDIFWILLSLLAFVELGRRFVMNIWYWLAAQRSPFHDEDMKYWRTHLQTPCWIFLTFSLLSLIVLIYFCGRLYVAVRRQPGQIVGPHQPAQPIDPVVSQGPQDRPGRPSPMHGGGTNERSGSSSLRLM